MGERGRKREKGGRLSFKVAPVTVFPCGPPSEGWRKEREGWSVKEAGQPQKHRGELRGN